MLLGALGTVYGFFQPSSSTASTSGAAEDTGSAQLPAAATVPTDNFVAPPPLLSLSKLGSADSSVDSDTPLLRSYVKDSQDSVSDFVFIDYPSSEASPSHTAVEKLCVDDGSDSHGPRALLYVRADKGSSVNGGLQQSAFHHASPVDSDTPPLYFYVNDSQDNANEFSFIDYPSGEASPSHTAVEGPCVDDESGSRGPHALLHVRASRGSSVNGGLQQSAFHHASPVDSDDGAPPSHFSVASRDSSNYGYDSSQGPYALPYIPTGGDSDEDGGSLRQTFNSLPPSFPTAVGHNA